MAGSHPPAHEAGPTFTEAAMQAPRPDLPLPSLYLSHGSPMIALENTPAARFLDRLGPAIEAAFGRPRAVVVVSPHSSTRQPMALAAARHEAIHDFGGFPAELYAQRYDAAGDPALAQDVAERLVRAGWPARSVEAGGMDHGIWTVMKRAWPGAEVPVVPLTLVPDALPARQWALGEALAGLAHDRVLVIGSGAMTHNLGRFFGRRERLAEGEVAADVQAFRDWVEARGAARDWAALLDYRRQAPAAAQQHPTDEHWLPYYVAAGAGGGQDPAVRIHASVDAGVLAMDGFAFGPSAPVLAQALA